MLKVMELMAFSDYVVLDALQKMADEDGRTHTITYAQIVSAMIAPCSERTVQTSVKRLVKAGKIVVYGPQSRGYVYEVLDGHTDTG